MTAPRTGRLLVAVLVLVVAAGGAVVWLRERDGTVVEEHRAAERAASACAAFERAMAGIAERAPAEDVLADLDEAVVEATAAVVADPVHAQLASSLRLLNRRLRDDDPRDVAASVALARASCALPAPAG